jgi:hypothetical protein
VDGRKLLCRNREEITLRKAIILSLAVLLLFTAAAPAKERAAYRTWTIYAADSFTSYHAAIALLGATTNSALVHTPYPDAPFVVVQERVITADFVFIPPSDFYVVEKERGAVVVVGDGLPGTLPDGDVFLLYRK